MTTPAVTVPWRDERRPGAEHHGGPEVGQQQHEREVEGDQPLGVEPGVEVLAVDVAEPG